MSSVDFGRYKRIIQAFWDSEPKNDRVGGSSIWCLGKEYDSHSMSDSVKISGPENQPDIPSLNEQGSHQAPKRIKFAVSNGISVGDSEELLQESDVGKGWPPEFLDDCESRIWFTYRSDFPSIKKSLDASMTLAVRLRSLGDQRGFTSDTGWGCMIRSGQSLLANALLILRLGRGKLFMPS